MWKDLTLQQKAEIMKMSVANGVTDINDIQQLYDGSVGHRFDDAGKLITDEMLEGTDWYWDYPSAVHVNDPLGDTADDYNQQYLFNRTTGRLVPKSQVLAYANSKQHLPEVVHTFDSKDKHTIDVAKRLWGNDRFLAYRDLTDNIEEVINGSGHSASWFPKVYRDSLFSPNTFINKLDTVTSKTAVPKIIKNPVVDGFIRNIVNLSDPMIFSDGRTRASMNSYYDTPYFILDNSGKHFLDDYLSELSHVYQYYEHEPLLKDTDIIGEYEGSKLNSGVYDKKGTTEYNAHKEIEPLLRGYLLSPSETLLEDDRENVVFSYPYKELPDDIRISMKALGGHLFDKGGSKGKKKVTKGVNYYTNEAQAFVDELVSAGVRPVDAYAVAGNVFVESKFNHKASNNINGGHWGLVQNDDNIKKHIIKYYGDYSRNSQTQFLKDGLTGQIKGAKSAKWLQQRFDDYRRHTIGVKDASIAAKHFHDDYEKSRNEMIADRMKMASFYQTGVTANPTIAAYNRVYGTPKLDLSDDILYNSAQELKWTNITPSIQQTPWYNNVNSNLVIKDFTPQVKPTTPIPIEERFPIGELPDIAPLLSSILPDQRMPSYQQVTVPTYQSPVVNFDEPYILFGR